MSDQPQSRDGWLSILFVIFIIAGFLMLGLGVLLATRNGDYTVLALGLIAVMLPACLFALAGSSGGGGGAIGGGSDTELLQQQVRLLTSLNERVLISDQAKRIAFRQKDRDALREAIVEDIRIEDYDAAKTLIDEMVESYGYREEAEQFRGQLMEAEAQKRKSMVEKAVGKIDEICARHDYDLARHEANRIARMFPDLPGVAELPERVMKSRERHKLELERHFLEAAERDDVEKAMEVLKEMDKYLTPEEAAPYIETARGVVGKKKENLGVRFKMAVQDRNWIDALTVGETIVREFPNSGFATEVRDMLDSLRTRAAGQRAAMAGGTA